MPQWGPFNYTQTAVGAPLCPDLQDKMGCLKIQPVNKTVMGGANIANLSGPWDVYKYLQQLALLGLTNLSTVVPTSHPPFPCCPNSSSVELSKFANWLKRAHPLAVEHNIIGVVQIIWDWSHHLTGPHQDLMTPGAYVTPILTTLPYNIISSVSSGKLS